MNRQEEDQVSTPREPENSTETDENTNRILFFINFLKFPSF